MQTVTLANQKGGVGKTAVACLLAHYLVRRGLRVLVIDLDHQGNLTAPLRLSGKASIADFGSSQTLEGTAADAELPDGNLVLIPADGDALLTLERQGARHNDFASNFRHFIASMNDRFDACVIDTNPNPDIRLISALVASGFVLSPIQLNQEAIQGIGGLVKHPRVGVARIKAVLNPALELIGILPTMVEATPFQRANLEQIAKAYSPLLIRLKNAPYPFARLPKRTVIAEAQASGAVLWEIPKARETWKEIEPVFAGIAARMKLKLGEGSEA